MRDLNDLELDAVGGGYWDPPPKDTGGVGEGTDPWPTKPPPGGPLL